MPASWTSISDALLALKKPFTYVLARQMRDNPIAIAEGAVGAPRVVVPTALSTAEIDTTKVLSPDGSGGVVWQAGVPLVNKNGTATGGASPDSAEVLLDASAGGTWRVEWYAKAEAQSTIIVTGWALVRMTGTFIIMAYYNDTFAANVASITVVGGGTGAPPTFLLDKSGTNIRVKASELYDFGGKCQVWANAFRLGA